VLLLLYCKFRDPRSDSGDVSKQHRSQNEVEKAMVPRNKLAKIFLVVLCQFSTVTN